MLDDQLKEIIVNDDVVVIGGGPAGVEAALAAAPHVERVHLICGTYPGDWSRMLPSRIWLAALDDISRAECSPYVEKHPLNPEVVIEHIVSVTDRWRRHIDSELSTNGIEVIHGFGRFETANEVRVTAEARNEDFLRADTTIIASGAEPFFPPGLEPDGDRVFSPGTITQLSYIPGSILVIGDGCIGFEFVDFFSRLGVAVTWIVLEGGPRSGFDLEIDEFLLEIFASRGVKFQAGSPVLLERGSHIVARREDGSRYEAEAAFVNVGHQPNTRSLRLEAAGIRTDVHGMIKTDAFCQTNVPGIYAVGDAVRFRAGNIAMGEARTAARHAVGCEIPPFDLHCTVIPFGYNPQAAKVGTVNSEDVILSSCRIPYGVSLATHICGDSQGFVRVAWDGGARIVGGHAVGWNAADILAPIAVAMKLGGTVRDVSSLSVGHPYFTELAFKALNHIDSRYSGKTSK